MCGLLGFGIAGLIGMVALVFGVGSIFNGMASLSTSLALLGQTLLQPLVMLFAAGLGFIGGAGLVLGAPSVLAFYYRLKSGQIEAQALTAPDERPALLGESSVRPLPAGRVIVRRAAHSRRTRLVDLNRRM